jgi:hypothetical protein
MVLQINASISGGIGGSVTGYANFLNEYLSLGRNGDAGVDVAVRMRQWAGSVSGEDQGSNLDRARAEANTLLPTLGRACTANPDRPVLYVMQVVLYQAGYDSAPNDQQYGSAHVVPPPSPSGRR